MNLYNFSLSLYCHLLTKYRQTFLGFSAEWVLYSPCPLSSSCLTELLTFPRAVPKYTPILMSGLILKVASYLEWLLGLNLTPDLKWNLVGFLSRSHVLYLQESIQKKNEKSLLNMHWYRPVFSLQSSEALMQPCGFSSRRPLSHKRPFYSYYYTMFKWITLLSAISTDLDSYDRHDIFTVANHAHFQVKLINSSPELLQTHERVLSWHLHFWSL